MRRIVAACVLLLGLTAQQQPQEVTVRLSPEQAQLIVQTLSAIGCQNVAQWVVCQQAADLLRELREQLKAQVR